MKGLELGLGLGGGGAETEDLLKAWQIGMCWAARRPEANV